VTDPSSSTLTDRQLYEAVHVRMRALAGPAASDLDDLIQTAALQVFRSMARYDGSCSLTTWIYSVCYRVLLSERRWYRRWRLRFSFGDSEDVALDLPAPPDLLEARARARELHRALRQLSEKYRAVVVLHDLEDLTVAEVALVVGANQLTVRSRLRDGRKKLAQLLETTAAEHFGEPHELTPF
jgi:RNA polymerase sigma-70 factor, ECF subfamily